jgi:DNA helicase HerA-like ATPase
VFDLSNFEDEDKQVVYALISKILFTMQKEFKKTVTVFVDEASIFAPQNEAANAKKLKTGKKLSARTESKKNARRGRKFGLRQGYALQRPANFDKDVLANCTLRFIGRMEDENDFNAVEHLLKKLMDDMVHIPKKDRSKILFNQLQSFKPGQFYMCQKGDIQLIQVHPKTKTKHVGSTPEDDY